MTDSRSYNLDERLSAYLDGELTGEEALRVQSELRESPEAQELLRQYTEMRGWIKELPQEELPEDLQAGVLRQISEPGSSIPQATRAIRRAWNWKYGIPILATAAGMLFLVWSNPPRENQPAVGVAQNTERADSSSGVSEAMPEVAAKASAPSSTAGSEMLAIPLPAGSDVAPSEESGQFSVTNTIGVPAPHPVPSDVELGKSESMPLVASKTKKILSTDGKSSFEMSGEELASLKVGETVRALQHSGDEVSVVNLFVVDRDQALDSLQLILSSQKVSNESMEGTSEKRENSQWRYESKGREAKENQPTNPEDVSLVAVYVEASESQVTAALEDLKREQQQFLELAVEEPIETDEVSRVLEEQSVASTPGADSPALGTSLNDSAAGESAVGKPSIARRAKDLRDHKDDSRPVAARQQVVEMTPRQIDSLSRSRSLPRQEGVRQQEGESAKMAGRKRDSDAPRDSEVPKSPQEEKAGEALVKDSADYDGDAKKLERQMQVLFVLKQRPQPMLKARIPPAARPTSEPPAAPSKN